MNIAGNFPDDEAGEEVATSPGCEAGIDPDCGTESRDVNKEEMVAGARYEGEKTIDAIISGAKTGNIGDGKIFVVPLEECIRIRTGQKGNEAIG